ncbi:hypothetical protein BDQ17DRAFT_139075 [Cyathus striatus]|nr:hypothetical protein BDQ17DRAFT_139075 [Cyathus striatus]
MTYRSHPCPSGTPRSPAACLLPAHRPTFYSNRHLCTPSSYLHLPSVPGPYKLHGPRKSAYKWGYIPIFAHTTRFLIYSTSCIYLHLLSRDSDYDCDDMIDVQYHYGRLHYTARCCRLGILRDNRIRSRLPATNIYYLLLTTTSNTILQKKYNSHY